MTTPNPSELKTEIEDGKLATELRSHWDDTFPRHPTKPKELKSREGLLTPDALFHLKRILAPRLVELGWLVTDADFAAARAL